MKFWSTNRLASRQAGQTEPQEGPDDLGIHIVGHHEAEEELVHNLQMRPGPLEGRLIVFGIREGQRILPKMHKKRLRSERTPSDFPPLSASLFLVCRARKIFAPTMLTTSCINASLKQFRVLFTYLASDFGHHKLIQIDGYPLSSMGFHKLFRVPLDDLQERLPLGLLLLTRITQCLKHPKALLALGIVSLWKSKTTAQTFRGPPTPPRASLAA